MHRMRYKDRNTVSDTAPQIDRSEMMSGAFVSAVLVSLLAVCHSGVISDAVVDQVAPYSLIDPIIKAILEGLRPKLANLKIDDVNQTIVNPNLNGTIIVQNIVIKNADKFEIKILKSNLLPLKLSNLTLTWNNITAGATYDIDIVLGAPQLKSPIRIFAKGDASAILKDLFFTVGANVELKNKAIQIKPRGLFGFDLNLGSANVTFTSLMGSTEFGSSLGRFLSRAIPDLVSTLKKPLFDAFQDDIINIVNDVLRKNGTTSFSDDFEDLQDVSSDDDTQGKIDSFFGRPLYLGADLADNQFNFNF